MHRPNRFPRVALSLGTAASILLGAPAFAGGGTLGGEIIFSCDPVLDRIFIYHDETGDGTYNQPGETVVLYDDTIGTIPLEDPSCITQSPDDTAYIGDSTLDVIFALNDSNEDDDAYDLDPGLPMGVEFWVYFDGNPGGNAAGIRMESVSGVAVTNLGVVWVSMSNETLLGHDAILRLQDNNGDGDANDAGEAVEYFSIAPGSALGFSMPASVEQGKDGLVYYAETGSGITRGIYRLMDADMSGTIDQPGEVSLFYQPLPAANTPDFRAIEQDNNEYWFLLDQANHVVHRAKDLNANGIVDPTAEATIYLTLTPTSNSLDLAVTLNGHLCVGDDASNDTILRGIDQDGNGFITAGEKNIAYDDQIQTENTDSTRGLAADFHSHGGIGSIFCGGAAGNCPCGNSGTAQSGCGNSTGVGGHLFAEGSDSITNDDLTFYCDQVAPGKTVLFFQGTTQANSGLGNPFRDGLVCVGGSVRRLGTRFSDGSGVAELPPPHVAQGLWTVGAIRYFQTLYRDPSGPCGTRLNYSNGLAVLFTP